MKLYFNMIVPLAAMLIAQGALHVYRDATHSNKQRPYLATMRKL